MTKVLSIRDLWDSHDIQRWTGALDAYWAYVRPENERLEREFERLDAQSVQELSPNGWYAFLLEKYFRWKYTAPNRYESTTAQLRKYCLGDGIAELDGIRSNLFRFDKNDIASGLRIAAGIKGLGIAGASGLLAVLFPSFFGTVDQFALKALRKIDDPPERPVLLRGNPQAIGIRVGTAMIQVMRRKAAENARVFNTDSWTPRTIDMVLWACRDPEEDAGKRRFRTHD